MRGVLLAALACFGCGKELNPKFCAAHPDDERCRATVDSFVDSPDSPMPVAHLSHAIELMLTSDVDVTLTAIGLVVNTTTGAVPAEFAGAVVLPDVPQEGGPNVMVIQVGSFTMDPIADYIDVDGDKPLVIVATRTIELGGRINVSADAEVPGPGGGASAMGPGSGAAGMPGGTVGDGGGGGGSYGTSGGRGGNPMGGAAGAVYGAPTSLQGGSGGGVPSLPGACTVRAGAGGGAVQLTAFESVTITGRINAGGSGGAGGETCGTDGAGGGGGGSGGMIFLESPMLLGNGVLGSLGGGGGEAGSSAGVYVGVAGGDAGTETAGVGGASGNSGGDGGLGAMDASPGAQGVDVGVDGNGGGGGGGGGRIYYLTSGPTPAYIARPPASGP
jgi:hypothetical protein